ncbi:MAG: hypothetical protein H6R10_1276 [Rhodocyclaceae bacterium]|nr:hypothetical protein [Rhodocyclaceae bacterium]
MKKSVQLVNPFFTAFSSAASPENPGRSEEVRII